MDTNQFTLVKLSNGINANVEIVRSNRTKRISLKANRHGIYVIVPNLTSHHEIITFIESKKNGFLNLLLILRRLLEVWTPC